jgi:hypothetical protein
MSKISKLNKKKKCKKFKVFLNCGCCSEIVYFFNEDIILDIFNKIGYTSTGTIIDNLGNVVNGVDTFYGYSKL